MTTKMFRKISIVLVFVLSAIFSNAQTTSITGVGSIKLNAVDVMMAQGHVMGYYAYYKIEKADKKNDHYMLQILDNNLKTTHEVDFIKPKMTYLLDGTFNGSHFCFAFLNQKLKMVEYEIYDMEGKSTGTYQVKDLSTTEMQTYYNMSVNESGGISLVYGVEGQGFIVNRMEKESGWKVAIEMINSSGKISWKTDSGVTGKSYEAADIYMVNEKYAIASITTRPKMLSTKDFTTFINLYNVKTGKLITQLDLKSKINYLAPAGASYSEKDNEILIYGEYFGMKSGKPDIKNKKGFFVNLYDDEGKKVTESLSSWQGEIAKKLPVNQKGRMEDGRSIFVHSMVKTSDGNYYAIGEQFKKNISKGGTALKVLAAASGSSSSGSSVAKIDVYDMMIFSFDKELKLSEIKIIEKNKSAFQLPEGYGTVSTEKLGYVVKMWGGFDYAYTTLTNDNSNFTSIYLDYNRGKENKDSRYTVGAIGLEDGKVIDSKIKLTDTPFSFTTYPAKPGYVTIFEYFKKEKKATLTLEKLDL